MTAGATRGRVPPPRAGVRYYDAELGRWRYRPHQGPVVDLNSPEGEAAYHRDHGTRPDGFDARATLRRTGMRARDSGRDTFDLGRSVFGSIYDTSGASRFGIGAFLITAGASLLGLALLDTALRGRGPAAVQKILATMGGGITRLFAATDPLLAPTAATGSGSAAAAAAGSATGGLDPYTAPKPAAGVRGFRRVQLDPRFTQGGRTVFVDATIAGEVAQIAQHFGVRASSGYRDPAHNAEVGGANGSDHLVGGAVDFVGSQPAMDALQRWAEAQGFPYVEPAAQAGNHVHISFFRSSDVRRG